MVDIGTHERVLQSGPCVLMIVFFGLFLPGVAWSCYVPPQHLLDDPADLVARTDSIVLARATAESGHEGDTRSRFSFELIRVLKGEAPEDFILSGFSASEMEHPPGDFHGHRNPEFWVSKIGNSIQPGDCVAYGIFEVGRTYLVFLGNLSHYQAYENIQSDDDLWLEFVEATIEEQMD